VIGSQSPGRKDEQSFSTTVKPIFDAFGTLGLSIVGICNANSIRADRLSDPRNAQRLAIGGKRTETR
jgi:hypothetical protein